MISFDLKPFPVSITNFANFDLPFDQGQQITKQKSLFSLELYEAIVVAKQAPFGDS